MENSRKAIDICEADCRLGYHSEAEGFKFFPKKLRARIEYLENLLKTDFVEVAERLDGGLVPLEYYHALENGKTPSDAYILEKCDIDDAKRDAVGTRGDLAVSYDDDYIYLSVNAPESVPVTVEFSFKLFEYATAVRFVNNELKLPYPATTHQSVFGDRIAKDLSKYELSHKAENGRSRYILKIKRSEVAWTEDRPMKMSVRISDFVKNENYWRAKGEISGYLGKNEHVPGTEGWLVPKSCVKE